MRRIRGERKPHARSHACRRGVRPCMPAPNECREARETCDLRYFSVSRELAETVPGELSFNGTESRINAAVTEWSRIDRREDWWPIPTGMLTGRRDREDPVYRR